MAMLGVTKDSGHVSYQRDIGLWAERLTTYNFVGRPCLFLDRDGVIVEESPYLHEVEHVALIDGVAEAIATANRAAVPVAIATNQAGIGRGYYDWSAFVEVQKEMLSRLAKSGARIDLVLACAYHEDGIGPFKVANHPWRKPNCGMLQEAQRVLGVDLAHSFIVGDTISDLKAGIAAGLGRGALTLTGHGLVESAKHRSLLAKWRAQLVFDIQVEITPALAIHSWLRRIS
jgi:D-glycero-D-manno-heptose 1,7-bisphosphate phosphatase